MDEVAQNAIDAVDTEDPSEQQLAAPQTVRGEIKREVRQFERGPSAQPAGDSAGSAAPGSTSGPSAKGETQGKKTAGGAEPGGRERRAAQAGTQPTPAPPVINPIFEALSVPTHQATPETQWEIAQAAAESWLSALEPDRRQTLWHQWRQSQMHSRLMAKVIETLANQQQGGQNAGVRPAQAGPAAATGPQ